MGSKINLKGRRFGRWLVLEETDERKCGSVAWLCKCDCGTVRTVSSNALLMGKSVSCGCYNKDVITKHGMGRTRLAGIWRNIRYRCDNPQAIGANNYINRGIKICDEWANSFEAFAEWALANGYSDDLTIDRIDNNGNYEPSNCRWTTAKEQGRNKRNNVLLTCNGETHCLSEWAEITNQPRARLNRRRTLGWSDEEIILGRA